MENIPVHIIFKCIHLWRRLCDRHPDEKEVGVKPMSRLISRIRYRQFGIMVTTSYVDTQAYSEVVEDGHPILIVTATDIAGILRANAINSSNIDQWLKSLDQRDSRLFAYYSKIKELQENNPI